LNLEQTINAQPQEKSPEEFATQASYEVYFYDKRPPQKVQSLLERYVRVIFSPVLDAEHQAKNTTDETKLRFQANATVLGATYQFRLTFEEAFLDLNGYSLQMDVTWTVQGSGNNDYQRSSSESWFQFWTQEFSASNRNLAGRGSQQLYWQRREEALSEQQQLNSIESIQSAIVAALQWGASFRTSHKEGGTNIQWRNGVYKRSDYGDCPSEQDFEDKIEFLKMLRQFCNWDVTCHSPKGSLSEIDLWRLIYRRLDLQPGFLLADNFESEV
jgi:hypothetical protein